jgi:hypothetical protein
LVHDATNTLHGGPGFRICPGAFSLIHTKLALASYRALRSADPSGRGEDILTTGLLRYSGYRAEVVTNVPFDTIASGELDHAKAQATRWMAGSRLAARIFGKKVARQLELGDLGPGSAARYLGAKLKGASGPVDLAQRVGGLTRHLPELLRMPGMLADAYSLSRKRAAYERVETRPLD